MAIYRYIWDLNKYKLLKYIISADFSLNAVFVYSIVLNKCPNIHISYGNQGWIPFLIHSVSEKLINEILCEGRTEQSNIW